MERLDYLKDDINRKEHESELILSLSSGQTFGEMRVIQNRTISLKYLISHHQDRRQGFVSNGSSGQRQFNL